MKKILILFSLIFLTGCSGEKFSQKPEKNNSEKKIIEKISEKNLQKNKRFAGKNCEWEKISEKNLEFLGKKCKNENGEIEKISAGDGNFFEKNGKKIIQIFEKNPAEKNEDAIFRISKMTHCKIFPGKKLAGKVRYFLMPSEKNCGEFEFKFDNDIRYFEFHEKRNRFLFLISEQKNFFDENSFQFLK